MTFLVFKHIGFYNLHGNDGYFKYISDWSKTIASAIITKDSKNNRKSTILKLPSQYKTKIQYTDDYDYKQQFRRKYNYFESNGMFISKTI